MIVVPQSVTLANAPHVLQALVRELGAGGHDAGIDIDLAGCSEFDSSVLAVLLALERRARAMRAGCRVHNVSPKLRKLAALYGVDALIFGQS